MMRTNDYETMKVVGLERWHLEIKMPKEPQLDREGRGRKKKNRFHNILTRFQVFVVLKQRATHGESNDIGKMTLRTCQFAIVKEQCEWATSEIVFLISLGGYFIPLSIA